MPQGPDPYVYTTGRWLHRDQLQHGARLIQFDFFALCQRVIALCPGSSSIKSYDKKEGGFNSVFIFQMDNGASIVARIPFRIADPETLTTNSEVATMTYIGRNTDIPVPKVLEWNDHKTNPIGTEYIIMEHASGIQLHGKWPEMTSVQHMRCVRALSKTIKAMAALPFSAYGSIYFADVPIDSDSKIPLGDDFSIGPNCMREYWDCNPAESRYYQQKQLNSALSRNPVYISDISNIGHNLHEYCTGLLDQGFSRIPNAESAPKNELPYRGSVEEHHRLLKISGEVVGALEKSTMLQNLATPTLLHADLHKRNIFVSEGDPTIITSIIDWQSSSIEPAFAFADETPDLVNRNSVLESMLPAAGQEGETDDIDKDQRWPGNEKPSKRMSGFAIRFLRSVLKLMHLNSPQLGMRTRISSDL